MKTGFIEKMLPVLTTVSYALTVGAHLAETEMLRVGGQNLRSGGCAARFFEENSTLMHLHALLHAPSDGLGAIAGWAASRGHRITETHLYRGDGFPPLAEVDFLVLMGGAMNIYQHRDFPWLVAEKRYLAEAIAQGKRVLGICLGGQLIADVLGGKVYQNPVKEVGWWPVRLLDRAGPFAGFPEQFPMFHWHGDTFELPPGAIRVAASEGCANQAFLVGDRVVGLQFHLEITPPLVPEFVRGGEDSFVPDRFVQSLAAALQPPEDYSAEILPQLLDALAEVGG